MARIQILRLPPCGRDGEELFALIVDQCTPVPQVRYVTGTAESPEAAQQWKDIAAEHNRQVWSDPAGQPLPLSIESEQERWRVFAEAIGACAVVFTAEQVDLPAQSDGEEPTEEPTPTSETHFHFTPGTVTPQDIVDALNRVQRRDDGATGARV